MNIEYANLVIKKNINPFPSNVFISKLEFAHRRALAS